MVYASSSRRTTAQSAWWSGYGLETAAYWTVALLISLLAALAIVVVFQQTPIPPGGDPGNWASSSFAYLGWTYPSQLVPLSYPPVLFPLLGVALLVGGLINGVTLFAGALMFALGLSTAALAGTLLRSRVVALAVVGLVLADPPMLAMFFWGAYPNLLAFVFLNLALVGLIRAGQGHTSAGAAQFWGFFALTMLTHSLVGVALAGTAALYLVLGSSVTAPDPSTAMQAARAGSLDSPRIAANSLFYSRGGRAGLAAFVALVGGYYLLTYLSGIPHPYYFASNAAAFRVASESATFQAIIPALALAPALVLTVLVGVTAGGVFLYAWLRDRRPELLTTPAVLLIAWIVAISLAIIGGFLAQIVTDYHRFGFLYIAPIGLALGYLLERSWVLVEPVGPRAPAGEAPDPVPHANPRLAPVGPRSSTVNRPAVFAVVATAILGAVVVTATLPAMEHDDTIFTEVGHDSEFLQAIAAIRGDPVKGGIMTVDGADKWARELTDENTFAPYTSTEYLFYPGQAEDSELSYFALLGEFTSSNGLVAASVHGTVPAYTTGIPDYAAYVGGAPRATLRIAPDDVRVTLYDPSTDRTLLENLTDGPAVSLPANVGEPLAIAYREPSFDLNISVVTNPTLPDVNVTLSASALAPYEVVALNATIAPPLGASALPWASGIPGSFYWTPVGADAGFPTTFSNVTPTSALLGTTSYDPGTGGPAALIGFRAPAPTGEAVLTGGVDFATPAVSPLTSGLSGNFYTPAIWGELGVRYLLLENETAIPEPYGGAPNEIPYLAAEYGLPVLYHNPQWTVLEVPAYASPPDSLRTIP